MIVKPMPVKVLQHFSGTLKDALSSDSSTAESVDGIIVSREPHTITFTKELQPPLAVAFDWMKACCTGNGFMPFKDMYPNLSFYQFFVLLQVCQSLGISELEKQVVALQRAEIRGQISLEQVKIAYRTTEPRLKQMVVESVGNAALEERLEDCEAYEQFAAVNTEFGQDLEQYRLNARPAKSSSTSRTRRSEGLTGPSQTSEANEYSLQAIVLPPLRYEMGTGLFDMSNTPVVPEGLDDMTIGMPNDTAGIQYIKIPKSSAGSVIGRKGSTLAKIRSKCGVRIVVSDQRTEEATERLVKIKGSIADLPKAVRLVLEALEKRKTADGWGKTSEANKEDPKNSETEEVHLQKS